MIIVITYPEGLLSRFLWFLSHARFAWARGGCCWRYIFFLTYNM